MQSNNQTNDIYITKEVFIRHLRSNIEQHYQISSQCLGQGGFGQVFEAKKKRRNIQQTEQDKLANSFSTFQASQKQEENSNFQNEYRAIKIIQYEKNSDKVRMVNEIQILSYLDHPGVLKLYETMQSKKRLYMVTDLLKGGDLTSVFENERHLTEKQIKIIFQQIIKALNYIHSQNICHRDIKLQNILFLDQQNLNIAIIDFGLAYCWENDMKKQLEKTGQNKKLIGTPQCMSPQMITHNYDQRCDIWATGVILYQLLFKNQPFTGKDQLQIMNKIKNYQYNFQISQSFNSVSSEVKDLIEKIFKPQNQRITLQQILQHPWLKQNCCLCQKCSCEQASTQQIISSKKSVDLKCQKINNKFKTVQSCDRFRKLSYNDQKTYIESQNDSYESQNVYFDERPQQLTVQKMQYYCNLSKLDKLLTIYSVSKLSQSKTKKYGFQYISIDRNLDGMISIQDLTQYLFQMERFCDKQKTQYFFNGLSLSQRGYISYTQYLACVLSSNYNSKKINKNNLKNLQQDDDVDLLQSINCGFSQTFQNNQEEYIDIYSQYIIYDFFLSLDKNKDGLINMKDFIYPLKESNIQNENQQLIKEIQYAFKKIQKQGEKVEEQEKWSQDPRKFKRFLSRTYKGEKDGGTQIDFTTFKSLIKNHQKLLKKTIL